MAKIKEVFNKRIFWTYLIVIFISLLIIMRVFASLAPAFIIMEIANVDEQITFDELIESVHLYAQEGAKNLGIKQKTAENYILFNVLISIPTLVIGFFVVRKKEWARKLFIFLLLILMLQPLIVDFYNSKSILRVLNSNTIIFLIIILFFQRKSTIDIFLKEDA